MRFAITGTDARFQALRELLIRDGHEVVPPEEAEIVIPPPWEPGAFYTRSESYAVLNAALTAEGALALLERAGCVPGPVLILGYGRVGRFCAGRLLRAGCRVTVAARRPESRAWAAAEGCRAVESAALPGLLPGCRALVNTVPARLLDAGTLALLPPEAVLLELASAPGGAAPEEARALPLRYMAAPGLPAQVDARRAAEILRDAVYECLAAPRPRLGAALTGSHCTFDAALSALEGLRGAYDLVPILSPAAAETDTRFGAAFDFRRRLESLCGGKAACVTIAQAERFGAAEPLDALLVVPCTGNTLAKLARGVTDTAVTMAAKAHLRNARPLILAVSTNDGLSGAAGNIAALLQRKNVFFVPFRQDDPTGKPFSLQAELSLLPETVAAARCGEQLQPVLLG